MQFEEWDLTFRLPLVVIVRRIHLYHLLPEADFLFWVHFLCPYPHLAISDLDRCVRVGLQVQVPCRVGRRAALRGDDHEIFAVHRDPFPPTSRVRFRSFGAPLLSGSLRAAETVDGPEDKYQYEDGAYGEGRSNARRVAGQKATGGLEDVGKRVEAGDSLEPTRE